jgi:hypothetical protein
MMSENSGAAQYWFWDRMIGQNLFGLYASATAFLKASGQENESDLKSTRPEVKTTERGSYSFGPGGGWGNAAKTRFAIDGNGGVDGAGSMPSFFQGKAHKEMFPSLEFDVNYKEPGDFAVSIGNVAKSGASLALLVDGKPAASHDFAAADRDTFADATLHASIPIGSHKITLENSGADWVSITRFTLKPYGSALHALARQGEDYAAAWIYREDAAGSPPLSGSLMLTGLSPGQYNIVFWDTEAGKQVGVGGASIGDDGVARITLPPVSTSMALYMKK